MIDQHSRNIAEQSQIAKNTERELQQQLGIKSDVITAGKEQLTAKTEELASLREQYTALHSELEAATNQPAQIRPGKKRPFHQLHTGLLHEVLNVQLELEQPLVGVEDREIISQIRRLLPKLRDNIGKQINTFYEEHILCATSKNEGSVLQYTDTTSGNKPNGFVDIGCYKITA